METQQGSGSNVKRGIGFDRYDGSTMDSNGYLGLDAESKFALCTLLERITLKSVLIAQTMVAELVNRVRASRGQGLPRYMLYGAFSAQTKHIHH